MANNLIIWQEAVAIALRPYLDKGLHSYHYMDDTLVWEDSSPSSSQLKDHLISSLSSLRLKIAPHKIQLSLPIGIPGDRNFLTSILSFSLPPISPNSFPLPLFPGHWWKLSPLTSHFMNPVGPYPHEHYKTFLLLI